MPPDGLLGGDHDPPARVTFAPHGEPAGGEARKPPELAAVDCLGRRHEGAGAASLHLDEHVAIPVATDQIDLTEARSLIPGDDAEAAPHELDLSRALSREPEGTSIHADKIGPSLRGRDADDPVARTVVGREIEEPVGALPSGAEATVSPVEEDVTLSRDRAGDREAAEVGLLQRGHEE